VKSALPGIGGYATGAAQALLLLYGLIGVGRVGMVQFYFGYHPRYFTLAPMGDPYDLIAWAGSGAIALIAISGRPWRIVSAGIALILLAAGLSGASLEVLMASGLTIPSMALIRAYGRKELPRLLFPLILSLSGILAALEVGALSTLIAYPFQRTIYANPIAVQLLRAEFQLAFLAYPLLLTILILLLTSGLVVIGLLSLTSGGANPLPPRTRRSTEITILSVIAALSLYLSHYAWAFGSELVGVDAPWYRAQLGAMAGPLHAIAVANGDPRGIFLLILYAIQSATASGPTEALRLGIALCALLNGASAYLLSSRYVGLRAGILSGILAVLAVQTSVGFFAGIYANWLALGLAGFYFYALLALAHGRRGGGAGAVSLSLLILLLHPWTWTMLAASTALLAFLLWLQSGWERARPIALALALLLAIPASALAILLPISPSTLYGARVGLGSGMEILPALRIGGVTEVMKALRTTLESYVQGFMADPLQLSLAGLGAISLARMRSAFSLAIASWATIPGMAALFVTPSYQWRLLYAMPLGLLSGMGLALLIHLLCRFSPPARGRNALACLLGAATLAAMLSHILRAIAHTIWMFPI